MLLLTADQVEYCRAISPNQDCDQAVSGVLYQHKLYTLEHTFAKSEKARALQVARREYLDQKGLVGTLVLEEAHRFSIWLQNDALQKQPLAAIAECAVSQVDLSELVGRMRNIGGISIQDRTYRLKTFKRCFIGEEAVTWFQGNLELSRADAIRLGQRLIDEHWIHHVTDDHQFEDNYLFYRFYWDEQA